jgi:hypothetical protein
MATTYEIIQGIHQAAANGYDGALTDDGKPVEIGLRREEGHPINDSRVMDGFKVTIGGDVLKVIYQADIKLKETHDKGFENEIASTINDVVKFLKKEYKKVTGNTLGLTKQGEPDILIQRTSNVRTWVQAVCSYKIGGLKDVDPVGEPSEDNLDDSIKKWLSIGKDSYPGTKKPKNVTRKGA